MTRLVWMVLTTMALGCGDSSTSPTGQIQDAGGGGHAGASGSAGSPPQAGAAGQPNLSPASCRSHAPGAGPSCGTPAEDDCCASLPVPGGSFYLDYDGVVAKDKIRPATVASFTLDRYEVTVGRFRAFLEALPASLPHPGDGAHPLVPGSGWQSDWSMAQTKDEFFAQIGAHNSTTTPDTQCSWSPQTGGDETSPAGCLTWYELFAFCAWDGGRLPTSAEFYYAAAGGSEQRVYPWSVPASSRDTTEALPGITFGAYLELRPVGSFPRSEGRWHHADLLGNVSEYMLDAAVLPSPLSYPCSTCVVLGGLDDDKVVRDFGWGGGPETISAISGQVPASWRSPASGGRCARKP